MVLVHRAFGGDSRRSEIWPVAEAEPVSAANSVPTEAIIIVYRLRSTSSLKVSPSSLLRAPWPFSIDESVREPVNAS
jgi:hypothetical protein